MIGKVHPRTTNLSEICRATSVRDYLSDLGIDSSRIEIISVGDEMATPNADPTTAGLERKAHFLILRDS